MLLRRLPSVRSPGLAPPASPRRGFTIVEILIVIVIIAILGALLLPAIQAALRRARLVREVDEMTKLTTALEAFKSKYGCYPPSRIRLRENTVYNPSDAFDRHSVKFLERVFPNIKLPNGRTDNQAQVIIWCKDHPNKTEDSVNNTNTAGQPGTVNGTTYELEGFECLVFFLGGIAEFERDTDTGKPKGDIQLHGFSTSASNPGNVPSSGIPRAQNRTRQLMEFQANRLYVRSGETAFGETAARPNASAQFEFEGDTSTVQYLSGNNFNRGHLPCYLTNAAEPGSGLSRPYAYFSSNGSNDYRPHDCSLPATGNWAETDDSSNLVQGTFSIKFRQAGNSPREYVRAENSTAPNPYTESLPVPLDSSNRRMASATFFNKETYQLISPGPNGKYGPGGKLPRDVGQAASDITPDKGDLSPLGLAGDNVTNVSGQDRLADFNLQQLSRN